MKKAYVTPVAEKVEFQYDKVVVASGGYQGVNTAAYKGGPCIASQEVATNMCQL